ncbi:MAG: DUF1080 domain-containing protein [Kangiellaceae bacterium]|nr:DUF1080 domain-containing protein [Kangiellaceae bacterium]MCW9015888.1 DUF1080 domain-containing protein [Kangiellaceae bacterium]
MKLLVLFIGLSISFNAVGIDNQLTEEEKLQGWQLLFNGKNLSEWRNFRKKEINKKWVVKNGAMHLSGSGGGDILTYQSFKNFDLKLEWKISNAGNSGIFILADEKGAQIYSHAPEVQILDNEKHSDNKIASHLSGSLYDMIASPKASHKKAGEWNQIRILLDNQHLQVWQNKVKTVDIKIGSELWNKLVAESKFANWSGFGVNQSGHIGLQDHGDPVSFKNIKIKVL